MMVELMNPAADETICDPACGTSGFLVAAGEYLKETRKEEIFYDKQKKEDSNSLEKILAQLAPTMEYSKDGYSGILTLDHTTIQTEAVSAWSTPAI